MQDKLPPPNRPYAFLRFPPDEDGPIRPVRLESLTREEVDAYRTASTTDSPPSTKLPPAQSHTLMVDPSDDIDSNISSACFGTWNMAGQPPLNVVLKSYPIPEYCDNVLDELDTYSAIAHMRLGPIVPTLHCILKAPTQAWIGLLLENAGRRICASGADGWQKLHLPRHEKNQLYNILAQLHRAGITHGDVAPRNVLRRPDGSFCFIDFERSQRGHRCAGSTCEELGQFREDLGV
ncbi:hypothetical protein FB45DRAFT_1025854 [Roridomyces roridus]|uniref:Protein kinase domain-containing protein n=1 Tax=Roridomyces roridus TaxID=1738132 RepID=A0AAD7BZK1_9AGAR|nr:hypothetical protein FB45DRAFT_1025854 [Roridomyces roridus]